jgi:hypothetical protein
MMRLSDCTCTESIDLIDKSLKNYSTGDIIPLNREESALRDNACNQMGHIKIFDPLFSFI